MIIGALVYIRGLMWVEYTPVLLMFDAEPYYQEFPDMACDSEVLDAW